MSKINSSAAEIDDRPIVVCIHSSASNGGQWRSFRRALRGRCRVFTPDLIGYGSRRYKAGSELSMEREVNAILEQIGDITEPFHLIGHSYGGAVATYFAKRYPERVKSLVVYEPANFAVLFEEGLETEASQEILDVRAAMGGSKGSTLKRWRAARHFISYWSGRAAWRKLVLPQRLAVASLAPKVAAEFDAIKDASPLLTNLSDLQMPVKILCGTKTRIAARRVCQLMAQKIEGSRLLQLVNLQHMAPLTDPDSVNPILVDHVVPTVYASARSAGPRAA